MNKINICENFKNENLTLIFNINYEGFSKYNKNETYMQIYNKFFNSMSENESLYEIIKCIITSVSLNEESNLNFNIFNNNEKVFELFYDGKKTLCPFMKAKKGNDIKALCGGNTVFTYDIDNFFRVNNEPFNLSHLLEYGNIASDFLGVQVINPIGLDFDIQRYLKFIIDLTGVYPNFEDETFNTNSIMLYLMQYYPKLKYSDEIEYLFTMVNKYLYLYGYIDVSDIPRCYEFKEYDLAEKLLKRNLSKK